MQLEESSRGKRIGGTPSRRYIGRVLLIIAVTSLNVACDRITKTAALRLEGKPPRVLLSGMILMGYTENQGAFLGAGSSLPEPLRRVLLVALPMLFLGTMTLYILFRRSKNVGKYELGEICAVACFLGGGGSNIWDRLHNQGKVIDFLNIGIGPVRTGIFNAADLSILLGCGILLILNIRASRKTSLETGADTDPPV